MDVETALSKVLKNALCHDGLRRGLHEAAKALDARGRPSSACFRSPAMSLRTRSSSRRSASSTALTFEQLGEWVGLAKVDKEGTARKVVGCSCVVVTDFGEESEALSILKASFAK